MFDVSTNLFEILKNMFEISTDMSEILTEIILPNPIDFEENISYFDEKC